MLYSLLSLHEVYDTKNLTTVVYTDQADFARFIIKSHKLVFSCKIIFENIDKTTVFRWIKDGPIYNIKIYILSLFLRNISKTLSLPIVICFFSKILILCFGLLKTSDLLCTINAISIYLKYSVHGGKIV